MFKDTSNTESELTNETNVSVQLTPRNYQLTAAAKCINYWNLGNRSFRYAMCTGAGKTYTAVLTMVEAFHNNGLNPSDYIIVVATHTNNLREQFEADIKKYAQDYRLGVDLNWLVSCYHSLEDKTPSDPIFRKKKIYYLLVDEAHQGGLVKEKAGSYTRIVKKLKPKHILGLSATDMNLDPELFGPKSKANTFEYTFKHGIVDGVINDCRLITIHTGLAQTILDSATGNKTELTADDLEGIYKQDLEHEVNLKHVDSVNAIEEANLHAAISIYLEKEVNWETKTAPQAIFFVSTKVMSDKGSELFRKLLDNKSMKKTGKKFFTGRIAANDKSRSVHSGNNTTAQDLADFKEARYPALFNVRQLQEGFNYPKLEVAFDCCVSVTNGARVFTQRLGRILRKEPLKMPSRYYACISLVKTKKNFDMSKDANLMAIGEASSSVEELMNHIDTAGTVLLGATGTYAENADETNTGDVEIPLDITVTNYEMDLSDGATGAFSNFLSEGKPVAIKTIESGLYVHQASGSREVNTILLSKLLKDVRSEHWADNFYDLQSLIDVMKANLDIVSS